MADSNRKQTGDVSSPACSKSSFHAWFNTIAKLTAHYVGTPWAFLAAVGIVIVWGLTGPLFKYSDTWQLVINTGTTIVTFLMVFLIQSTQNRDAKAIHLKLDELVRALDKARNKFVDVEDLADEDLDSLEKSFVDLRKRAEEVAEQEDEATEAIRDAEHAAEKLQQTSAEARRSSNRKSEDN